MEHAEALPRQIGHRYILLEKIGEGGMGTVFRSLDRLTGNTVALKSVIIPRLEHDETSRIRSHLDLRHALAQEFQMLSSLRHPNIISVLDYGFADENPFFTMTYFESADTIATAASDANIEIKVQYVIQILQALVYLHRRGVIHRDLKPANVLVVNDQVKVLDFGLAVLREKAQDTRTAGTLTYIAPEVLRDEPISYLSDLYAAGVILYELLTGQHPFHWSNPSGLAHHILSTTPSFDAINEISPHLASVVARLLAKEPEERFREIHHIIRELGEIIDQPVSEDSLEIRDSFLQAAKFTGRETEFAQLHNLLSAATDAQGGFHLVRGESGIGKTRLLEEVRIRALTEGFLVLRGQAISEGGKPYQVWREALRLFTLYTELADEEASMIKPLVPDIEHLLQRPVADPIESNDPREQRQRLHNTICNMFSRQTQPILIILEDLQWAGDSAMLLKTLHQHIKDTPIVVLGSFRDDDHNLPDELKFLPNMTLTRLPEDAIAQLSVSMLGTAGENPAVIALLKRESEGNIFFLIEIVRALAESIGGLEDIDVHKLPKRIFAEGIQTVVKRRIELVPPAYRNLLKQAAILGRQLDLHVLAMLAPEIDLDHWLNACANANVLDVQDDQWRFAHDKLREYVQQMLIAENEHETLHRQVAEAIEAVYPDSHDHDVTLARLWRTVGDDERELYYTSAAGQQMFRNSAFSPAADLLQRALNLLRARPITTQQIEHELDLQVSLALTLRMIRGFGHVETKAAYDVALALCQQVGDTRQHYRVLWGLWVYYLVLPQYHSALTMAERFLNLAQQEDDSALVIEGQRLMLTTGLHMGAYQTVIDYMEQILTIYDSDQHRQNAIQFGQDPAVSALGYGSWALWLMGFPERALKCSQHAVELAEELAHPYSHALATGFAAKLHVFNRDHALAKYWNNQTVQFSGELGIALLGGIAQMISGWTKIPTDGRNGLKDIRSGLTIIEKSGADYRLGEWLCYLAEAQAYYDNHVEAYESLARAAKHVEDKDEGWFKPEVYRQMGEAVLMTSGDEAAGERLFQQAIDIAQAQGAKMWELRATMNVAQLWNFQHKRQAAYALLKAIYNQFSEGFEMTDLREARLILENLQ